MRELKKRLGALEAGAKAEHPAHWHHVYQYEGQLQEEALAVREAEHGQGVDCDATLRVIIRSPLEADGRSTGAILVCRADTLGGTPWNTGTHR